jgi:hypothetical protein
MLFAVGRIDVGHDGAFARTVAIESGHKQCMNEALAWIGIDGY